MPTCRKNSCICQHRKVAQNVVVWGTAAAKAFRLKLRGLKINESLEEYGSCSSDGVIEIRLTHRKRPWAIQPLTFIADTLAHELAHLAQWEHGKTHKEVKQAILFWLSRQAVK